MWGRGKSRSSSRGSGPTVPDGVRPLRAAIRNARIQAAERTGVVVVLRDAEFARLELVNEELDPVFAGIPDGVELFDRGLSRGDIPRLWIDAIAHIERGRDKRMYRFVQDSRFGRKGLAESPTSRDIVDARQPCARMHMVVAGDDELGADRGDRPAECGGVDETLVVRRRIDRRMMNHDDAEQARGPQFAKHFGGARDLLVAELAGGHER